MYQDKFLIYWNIEKEGILFYLFRSAVTPSSEHNELVTGEASKVARVRF